jgi:hypothetical protein
MGALDRPYMRYLAGKRLNKHERTKKKISMSFFAEL